MSTATSGRSFDLIFLFGPPLLGKSSYLPKSFFRQDNIQITPSKLFEDNPSYGLRDVSLQIISELRKDKQVIVEDELHSANTRKSILSTVTKKVPGCRALLVKCLPAHGLFQVLWSHQNNHGRGLLQQCSCDNMFTSAKRWFDPSDLMSVDYHSGFVDAPEENEGFEVRDVNAQFQVQSKFKCEVPALCIQWEAAVQDSGDLNSGLANVCRRWTTLNRHGRIILFLDGKKESRSCCNEKFSKPKLRELSIQIQQCVYVVRMTRAGHGNSFCIPPQPGVLAFLQTQHLIDLHAKHTVYIFESVDHMKMAQSAGVKYVTSNKVYRYSEKTLSNLCVVPPVPCMLKEVKIVKDDDTVGAAQTASLPLLDKCIKATDGFTSQGYQNGLEEYVFIPDVEYVLKIQDSFASHVTPADMHGSKIVSVEKDDSVGCASQTKDKPVECKKSTSIQKLPVWMTRRLNRNSTESSVSSVDSDGQETSFKFTKTVYLLSEKELKEMALQVMKQAGKFVQENTIQEPSVEQNDPG